MSALSDFLGGNSNPNPPGLGYAYQVPQYRLEQTAPAIQENAAIGKRRLFQDWTQRTLPGMNNAGAAMGQIGSTGLNRRVGQAFTDYDRQRFDITRNAALMMNSIKTQNALSTFGGLMV